MPTATYSTRFLATAVSGTWIVYVCPAGFRAVVRDVCSFHSGAVAGTVQLTIAAYTFYSHSFPAQSVAERQELRQVFYGGEELRVFQSGGVIETLISGYLFRDVAGRQAHETDGVEDPAADPPAWALER